MGGRRAWVWAFVVAVGLWALSGCSGHKVFVRAGETDLASSEGQRLVPQLGHTGRITSLTATADGRIAVTVGGDGLVKVWDLEAGLVRATLQVSHGGVAIALSPDGRWLATGGARRWVGGAEGLGDLVALDLVRRTTYADDLAVRLWDLDEGRLKFEAEGHDAPVTRLTFSADGTRLLSGDDDGRVIAWDVARGEAVGETGVRYVPGLAHWLKGDKSGITALVQPSADRVVLLDTLLHVVELSGELSEVSEGTELEDAVMSGELIGAWLSADGDVIIEDRKETLVRVTRATGERSPVAVAGGRWFSQDLLAGDAAGQQVVVTSQLDDGPHTLLVDFRKAGVVMDEAVLGSAATFLPDGRIIVAVEHGLQIWSPSEEPTRRVRTIELPPPLDHAVGFAWKGQGVVTACGIWSLETGQLRPEPGPAERFAVSADGATIAWARPASEGDRGTTTVEIVDAARGTRRSAIPIADRLGPLALSPDGSRLAVLAATRGATFQVVSVIYDTSTGQPVAALDTSPFAATAAAWVPDGGALVVGGQQLGDEGVHAQGGIVIFDARTGARRRVVEGVKHEVHALAVSADGELIGVGGRRSVHVYGYGSGELRWQSDAGHVEGVVNVAFSPDGAELATGDRIGQITRWEVSSGEPQGQDRMPAPSFAAGAALAYSPDGRFLAMANPTVRLIRRADGAAITLASFSSEGGCDGLAAMDGGLFAGTDRAMRHIAFRTAASIRSAPVVTADQLFETFHRAGLLPAFAEGRPVAEAAPPMPETPAPTVRFAAATPEQTSSRVLPVQLYADGHGAEIGEVRLFVNGARVEPSSAGTRGFRRAGEAYGADAVLSPGVNLLEAEAFSADGRVRSARISHEVTLDVAPVKPRLYVLAVALDEYADPAQPLSYAKADVDAAVKQLESIGSIFEAVKVTRVADAGATREAIEAALTELAREARPEDVFVLYAAAHGIVAECDGGAAEYHLLTWKASLRSDPTICAEGLSESRLAALLRNIPARKKLMVLDTCQAGAAATGKTLLAVRGAVEIDAIKRLGRSEGVAIVAAAKATEYAAEVPSLGHGLFTWVMLQGMDGKAAEPDGVVTVFGLFQYLQRQVPTVSEEVYGRPQYPITVLQGQDFPLGLKAR